MLRWIKFLYPHDIEKLLLFFILGEHVSIWIRRNMEKFKDPGSDLTIRLAPFLTTYSLPYPNSVLIKIEVDVQYYRYNNTLQVKLHVFPVFRPFFVGLKNL